MRATGWEASFEAIFCTQKVWLGLRPPSQSLAWTWTVGLSSGLGQEPLVVAGDQEAQGGGEVCYTYNTGVSKTGELLTG